MNLFSNTRTLCRERFKQARMDLLSTSTYELTFEEHYVLSKLDFWAIVNARGGYSTLAWTGVCPPGPRDPNPCLEVKKVPMFRDFAQKMDPCLGIFWKFSGLLREPRKFLWFWRGFWRKIDPCLGIWGSKIFRDFLSKTDPFRRHIPVWRFYGSTPPELMCVIPRVCINRVYIKVQTLLISKNFLPQKTADFTVFFSRNFRKSGSISEGFFYLRNGWFYNFLAIFVK